MVPKNGPFPSLFLLAQLLDGALATCRLILETDPQTVANRVQMRGADDGIGDQPSLEV